MKIPVEDPILILGPANFPVFPDEVISFGRMGDTVQLDVVERLIEAATERAESHTGLKLITQTWQISLSQFPTAEVVLPGRPLQGVTSITYTDSDDVAQVMNVTTGPYITDGAGSQRIYGLVKPLSSWPVGTDVKINYTVGFGDNPEDVPALIRHAIILMAATWYDVRLDQPQPQMPSGSIFMLNYWRRLAVA